MTPTWLTSVDITRAERTRWKDKKLSFQPTLWLSSASAADESHSVGWKLYILSFHWVLSAPAMSTDMSQVGVTHFPSFQHFLRFVISVYEFCRVQGFLLIGPIKFLAGHHHCLCHTSPTWQKNRLKRGEMINTYLTHVCRLLWSV